MRLRSFLQSVLIAPFAAACSIPVVGNSPEEVKHRKLYNFKIQDIPEVERKELVFYVNGFKVNAAITTNFLIPYHDKGNNLYWETNCYKTWYKCIAEAHDCIEGQTPVSEHKSARFESKQMFEIKYLEVEWNSFIEYVTERLNNPYFVANIKPYKKQMIPQKFIS